MKTIIHNEKKLILKEKTSLSEAVEWIGKKSLQ
jgi:hypothetical protein